MNLDYPTKLDKLDKKDIAIMRELELDSRESFKKIGKKVGLSGEVVEYRIRNLKRISIIHRMFAEPNLQKLGFKPYRVYIKMANMPKEVEERFVSTYSEYPTMQWFAACDGEWDYILRFMLRDEREFKKEIEKIISEYGRYIRKKDIAITLYDAYLPITYLTGGERVSRISIEEEGKTSDLDRKDLQILYYLCQDARIPSIEIAKETGISPDAVSYRMKKMVQKRIIKYFTCWFNRTILGYECYKVFFYFQHLIPKKENEIIRYCEQHPNVTFLTRVVGSWDLEADFDAKNTAQLHEIILGIRNKFSDNIREHTTVAVLKNWVPNPFRGALK